MYAVRDNDNDGRADSGYIIAKGLNTPNGVAFKDGNLYVAETLIWKPGGNRILSRLNFRNKKSASAEVTAAGGVSLSVLALLHAISKNGSNIHPHFFQTDEGRISNRLK